MLLQAGMGSVRLGFRYWLGAYALFVVFASLYPFRGLKDLSLLLPGILDFFSSGLPRYWTSFDLIANVLVYIPLAAMLHWALQIALPGWMAALLAFALCSLTSLGIEWFQILLPSRVPSLLDWLLNTLGAALGALTGFMTERERLEDWLGTYFGFLQDPASPSRQSRGILLALLLLWLLAQFTPQSIAFSVGRFSGDYFAVEAQLGMVYGPILEAGATALSVLATGLMIQALLGPGVNPVAPTLSLFVLAILVKAAVAAWLLGASVAFGWFSAATQGGLLIGLSALSVVSMTTRFRSTRMWWLIIACLLSLIILYNLAPESDYHNTLLQAWNPKHLRAVEAMLAWLGMLWPWLALLYCVRGLVRPGRGLRP